MLQRGLLGESWVMGGVGVKLKPNNSRMADTATSAPSVPPLWFLGTSLVGGLRKSLLCLAWKSCLLLGKISWLFTWQLDFISVFFLKGPPAYVTDPISVHPHSRPGKHGRRVWTTVSRLCHDSGRHAGDYKVCWAQEGDAVSRGSPTWPLARTAVRGAESSRTPHRPPSGMQRFVSNFTFSFISSDYLGSWTKNTLIALKAPEWQFVSLPLYILTSC